MDHSLIGDGYPFLFGWMWSFIQHYKVLLHHTQELLDYVFFGHQMLQYGKDVQVIHLYTWRCHKVSINGGIPKMVGLYGNI